jgi:4-hydroxy-3-methylbut-2-en-1-yl diphosphate reductase
VDKLFGEKNLFENSARTVNSGRFKIILPDVFGFCGGVIGALKKLDNIINLNDDKKIYLLGEIIHNPTVNQYFISSGVSIISESNIDDIFNIADQDDYIIIPAFGIPLLLERAIRKKYRNVIDTTCKNVKSVWNFISSEAKNKSTIILYGKPGHQEVQASISRAENSSCIIILPGLKAAEYFSAFLNDNDLASLKTRIGSISVHKEIQCYNSQLINPDRFAMANQTTMLYSETLKAEKIIRETIEKKGSKLIACDTICRATYLRQKAARKICHQKPDLIFVVGGYESSNTLHLYKLAQKYSPVYYIKAADSIDNLSIKYFIPEELREAKVPTKQILKDISVIAIFAGASCPFTVINEIIEKFKGI